MTVESAEYDARLKLVEEHIRAETMPDDIGKMLEISEKHQIQILPPG